MWNMAVLLTADIALLARAVCEEQTLARDEAYRALSDPRPLARRSGAVLSCQLSAVSSSAISYQLHSRSRRASCHSAFVEPHCSLRLDSRLQHCTADELTS